MTAPAEQPAPGRWGWRDERNGMAGFAAVVGHFALTAALVLSLGFFNVSSLILVLVALGLALTGCCLSWPEQFRRAATRLTPIVLCVLVAIEFAAFCAIVLGINHVRGLPLAPPL